MPRKKIESLLVSGKKSRIKEKYEEIYKDAEVWLYKKSDGVHSIVFNQIKKKIKNKEVLDVGCGAGRLSIMMAHVARHVEGFDFSETAVEIAKKNAVCCGIKNVNFFVEELEKFPLKKRYDVITLIGVLEHVEDPVNTLKKLNKLLKRNGYLIVACPNFMNFRGYTYMTLLKLFELPMSLADLRQVSYLDMRDWVKKTGFMIEKSVGALYNFAWTEKAVKDMVKRVPAAIRDKKLRTPVNYHKYKRWLESTLEVQKTFLKFLEKKGFLKRITRQVNINFVAKVKIKKSLLQKMRAYMYEDLKKDPYYADVPPICYFGGETIYILKKR